ncbi:uncharacterized protein EAF02_000256 [Botrytis sinoallii]|uniref:uncharacterized protein n=1 Tax=Botrytis sinoallii TaxID=1463999 RepID=UPI0018FFC913|nr:uncharacterized protein EAF02_000256 [Botrytis sinoallii]KAF7892718.1 hypothetical protein EAF02_000256 [Botrytis sinoallii]
MAAGINKKLQTPNERDVREIPNPEAYAVTRCCGLLDGMRLEFHFRCEEYYLLHSEMWNVGLATVSAAAQLPIGQKNDRHYCTTAICCPSRVTLWTGKNAHNTNVTDVAPPYGGYQKFVEQGFNDAYLPVWLEYAGYSTFYTGKLFNHHTVSNWNKPHPAGWTSSDFLLDPFTYQYYNSTFQRNEHPPVSHEGEYSTDVLAQKAYGLLDEGVQSRKPFFLVAAQIAPHANVDPAAFKPGEGILMTAPIPAERHKHLFPGAKVPRNANFNPDKPSGASWVKHLDQLTDEVIAYNE